MLTEKLDFATDADREHANIVRSKANSTDATWEFGARLLRFKTLLLWQQMTGSGAPFKDWTDYLRRGAELPVSTAFKYMDAATFPRAVVVEHGVEKAYWLKRVTDLTAAEETTEEALALALPLKGGGTKLARDMTAEEVQVAYRLMRDEGASAERPERRPKPGPVTELQRVAAQAVSSWIQPEYVRARAVGGQLSLDVLRVPVEAAADVFAALGRALRR